MMSPPKKSACQVRQDRLSNPPNYFLFHLFLVHLFYGRTKRLCPDPIVGLGAKLSERPFKILQNETKIIKIRQAVLEIFNYKDRNLDKDKKPKMLFLEVLHKLKNNGLFDVRNDKCTTKQ